MSDDLIKRSDAIDAIELVDWYHQNRNKDMVHGANSDEHQAWYKSQDIYEALENIPSANRPQGEWIKDGHHLRCNQCKAWKGVANDRSDKQIGRLCFRTNHDVHNYQSDGKERVI